MMRMRAKSDGMPSPPYLLFAPSGVRRSGFVLWSGRDRFAISRLPTPGARAIAAAGDALLVDLRDDIAVTGEQRLGRAHLRAKRQLAFRQAVAAVSFIFGGRIVLLRFAGAECAFVHFAARTEIADARILRRAERAGVEAVAAADADVLGVQDDGVGRGEDRIGRADRLARRVGAMHAGHGDRALARLAVVQRDNAPAIDAPGHIMLILAGGDASVAFDATIGVAEKFHSRHVPPPYAALI